MTQEKIVSLSETSFDTEILKEEDDQLILVDFYAPWCAPCKKLAPFLNEIAEMFSGIVKVYKVNVDECYNKANEFNIRGVPTLILFKNGKEIDRIVGVPSEDSLVSKLKELSQ